jgi:hypothetical protein
MVTYCTPTLTTSPNVWGEDRDTESIHSLLTTEKSPASQPALTLCLHFPGKMIIGLWTRALSKNLSFSATYVFTLHAVSRSRVITAPFARCLFTTGLKTQL